jgi:DNA-binding FadR family transcriptional regulator
MTDTVSNPQPPWEGDALSQPFVKEKVKATAAKLFAKIASEYTYGTRIEAERELADEFDVTRTTIRQALEFLESYGIVARRPNSGTFVTYRPTAVAQDVRTAPTHLLDVRTIAETASPFEMSVICSILEPEMVRLATLNLSTRELAVLRKLIEEIEGIVADAERFAHLEKQFLMTIAEGTHIPLFVTMYGIVNEVRRQPHWCETRIQMLSPERIIEGQKKLRSLYKSLASRDIEGAVEFMKLLIASTQEDMIYSP